MKIFTKFKELFSHSATQRKERMVIITALLCFAISGIALPQIKAKEGTLLDASAIQQEQDTETSDTSISSKKKQEEKKKESPSELKEAEKKEEEKEEEKEEQEASDAQKETEKKEAEKKATEDNTSANNGSSSSSNNNSGSSSSTPATPAAQPEKVWVPPVYKTVHHDAVYNTVTVVVCNYCGAEFGSAGEFQAHKDANGG